MNEWGRLKCAAPANEQILGYSSFITALLMKIIFHVQWLLARHYWTTISWVQLFYRKSFSRTIMTLTILNDLGQERRSDWPSWDLVSRSRRFSSNNWRGQVMPIVNGFAFLALFIPRRLHFLETPLLVIRGQMWLDWIALTLFTTLLVPVFIFRGNRLGRISLNSDWKRTRAG